MNLTETTEALKKSFTEPLNIDKAASWTQSTGLVEYNLERPAKSIVPVITPLRNSIPRVKAVGGTQANWKAITSFDSTGVSAGVSEGNRGAEIAPVVADYSAKFVGIGLESSFSFEAEYAAEGFDDVRARNSEQLLKKLMIEEEKLIVGGLGTFGLGTTPTPVAALNTGKGTMTPAVGLKLFCVALTAAGMARATVAAGLPGQITRTNADATTDTVNGGNAKVSAASNAVTTAAADLSINGTVASVPGAAGYAWYCGAAAGTAALAAITTLNKVTLLIDPAGTQKADDAKVGTDFSKDTLVFDGFISQAAKSGSNAYVKSLDGTAMTSDGAGGIVEIDAALQAQWDNFKLSPTVIYVAAKEAVSIKKLVIANGGAPLLRFMSDVNGVTLTGGACVGQYLNPFGMGEAQLIPIKIHPYLSAGTILMLCEEIPYPLSNISNVFRMLLRRDYFQVEWPLVSRKRGFGVYFDGVLQHYAPFSMAVIQNVG